MERRNRKWEERWGSGEGKAKRGGERQPRGALWRTVHQLMWDWFSEMTEDWLLKSKPHRTFSFPDLFIFFNLAPVFPFPSLFPLFLLSPWCSFSPPPSLFLSSLVTQYNFHVHPPLPVCSHQGVFSGAINHRLKTRRICGKLRLNSPSLSVCFPIFF